MKAKKLLSCTCAAAMLFSIAAAPIGQASALQLDLTESKASPEMPAELKNREARNYLIEETPETWGDFLRDNVLVMPGDTFEYVVFDSEENKTVYTVSDEFMKVESNSDTEGFEIEGTVDVVDTTTKTYKSENEMVTKTWNTKWKNNTNCPLVVSDIASGSGPLGIPQWGVNTKSISVHLYKPYYSITYRYDDYGSGTYWGEPEGLFWAAGEYSDLTFPSEYWITDVPYKITVPKPTKEREHFEKFSQNGYNAEGRVEDKGAYIDYTVCWDHENYRQDFCGYGDTELRVYQAGGDTVTFNGNGGKVRGRDKWVLEVDELEGDSTDYGYDLDDFAPTREGDEFLGWCTKESALYGSFVTKDNEADVYELYGGSGSTGVQLYAKWKSETDEPLEKNGWEIYDDGTLGLLNFDGMIAWRDASENDPTLAPQVKSVKTGYKDEDVVVFADSTFKGCVDLEEFVMKEGQQLNSGGVFDGCTNLKKVYVNYNTETQGSIYYSLSQGTFTGAGKDLVVYVPEKDLDMYNEMFPTIAYLFNADEDDVRYPLTVNGQVVTQKNLTIQCGDGTATFDPETSTLTLENADLTDTLFAHFMKTYTIDEEGIWISYQASGIVSDLPKLNIVLKGRNVIHTSNGDLPYFLTAYQNVDITGDGSIEASFYSENYLITDPETGESVPKPASTGALYTTVDGDLTLDGISADRLFAQPKGKLTVKNCTLNGGVFSGNGDLTIENTSMQYFRGDAAGFRMPEDTTVTMNGSTLTLDKCTFDNVGIDAGENAEKLTIKDSSIHFDGAISAAETTKLDIINSTITGWSPDGGFTNAAEENITLTECEVTQGTLKGSGSFEILPESEINKDPEIFYSVYLDGDTWTRGSGKDFTVKIVRDPSDGDIAGRLQELVIDKETIAKGYYSIANIDEMSVSFTLDNDLLETLGNGKHDVTPVFDDGRCSYAVIIEGEGASNTDSDPNKDTDTDSEPNSDTDGEPDVHTSGDYDYLIVDDGNGGKAALIIGYNGSEESVTVPSSFDSIPVISVGQQAFEKNTSVKEVILPDGLVHIGPMAFLDCENLKSVKIPDSVTDIGDGAFANCGLESVELPEGLTRIGSHTFAQNPLTEIQLPDSVKEIAESAFWQCRDLEEIVIPYSVEKIGEEAFADCDSLKDVTILRKDTEIHKNAFTNRDGETIEVTLHGQPDSTAKTFAEETNNVSFEEMDDSAKAHLMFGQAAAEGYDVTNGEYVIRFEHDDQVIKLPENVTLDGAEFMGWYKVNWFNGEHQKIDEISFNTFLVGDTPENTAFAMDIEIYPVFKEIVTDGEPEITLDANGGKLGDDSKMELDIANRHGDYRLQFIDPFVPQNGDKVFAGWNTKADGSGISTNTIRKQTYDSLAPGDEIYVMIYDTTKHDWEVSDSGVGQITLYAVWQEKSEPAKPNVGTIKFNAGAWNSDRIAFYIWDETEQDVKFATKNGWVDEDPDEQYDLIEGKKLEDGTFESFEFEIPDDHVIYVMFYDPDNDKQTYDCVFTKDAFGDTAELTGDSIVWDPANGYAFDEVKFKNSGLTTRLYFDWNGNIIGRQMHPYSNGAFEVAILVYGFCKHLDDNGNSVVTFDKVQAAIEAFDTTRDDVMAEYLKFEGYDDRYDEAFARSVIYPSSDKSAICGDLDGDEQITASDALVILRASAGMTELDDAQKLIADVDKDTLITANDALAVLRASAGMEGDNNVGKPL